MVYFPQKTKSLGLMIALGGLNLSEIDRTSCITLTKEEIKGLLISFFSIHQIQILHYVIAHEHGDTNNHCHYQCFVELSKPFQSKLGGIQLNHTLVNLYCLFQSPKNCAALIEDGKDNKRFSTLIRNADVSTAIGLIAEHRPGLILTGDFKKIQNNLNMIHEIVDNAPIEKGLFLPKHFIDDFGDDHIICNWFRDNYIRIKTGRRRALVLFSEERCMGKTMFAKSLVDFDERRFIICRGNFNVDDFVLKPHAELLILDDMNWLDSKYMEMWKALVSSEATSIREAYMNYRFKHDLPTILTTNKLSTIAMMTNSPSFQYDCYFCKVEKYLGPSGTNPVLLGKRKMITNFNVDEMRKEEDEKREKKRKLNTFSTSF